MNYKEYIAKAGEDGYPLRYYRVRERVNSWLRLCGVILVPVTVVPGCNAVHAAFPGFSYVGLIVSAAVLGFALLMALTAFSQPQKIGYIDLTEDNLELIDLHGCEIRRIPIAEIRTIRERDRVSKADEGISGNGNLLLLEFVLRNGEIVRCDCAGKPFHPQFHEKIQVPLKLLYDHVIRHPQRDNDDL